MSRFLLALVGQSNENDAGPAGSRSATGGLGAPYLRNTRGFWPSCIEAMARRGHWLDVNKTAVGSTSLRDSWVGFPRIWVNGMTLTRGSWVLANGGQWKANIPVDTASVSSVAPTGTSDTTTGDGIAWIYAGVPGAGDISGTAYAYGSNRYDPNGYIANALASLANRPGYDAYGIYVGIGQGDHTVGTTRSQYAACDVRLAEHVTGLGIHIWLGVTIGMSGPDAPTIAARDATMTGVIQAGRNDALVALAGNPLVHAGADLRALIGVPTATADDTQLNSVNNTDYLHATSATFDQSGPYIADSLRLGGW